MEKKSIFTSRFGVGFALTLGRILPPRSGYLVAWMLARLVASRRWAENVRAVRSNQWIVHQKTLDAHALERATRKVFDHGGRCLYDMYHLLPRPEAIVNKVKLSPSALDLVERNKAGEHGAVLVGPHLSNFDLSLHSLALHGLRALVLSFPQPPSGYQWQNKLRTTSGLETVPISMSAFRSATERLRAGGMIITGVERPITSSQKYRVSFFGHPAALPVGHVQLALNTRVPVVVVSCHMLPDGSYLIDASEEIPMRPYSDRQAEITRNAEAILEVLEARICEHPCQWLMYYPVWPEAQEQMP